MVPTGKPAGYCYQRKQQCILGRGNWEISLKASKHHNVQAQGDPSVVVQGYREEPGHLDPVTSFPTYKIMTLRTVRPPLSRTQDNLLVSIENKRVPKDFCQFCVKMKTEKKKSFLS